MVLLLWQAAFMRRLIAHGLAQQPGPESGRGDRVDGPRITEPADRPDENHPVPLDRPRRGSFGRLGGAEEVSCGSDSDR